MQHITLGTLLNNEYKGKLLDHIKSFNQIYIRSTNYIRTIRSVAALLIAMFPNLSTTHPGRIPINYYENEMEENMHGV